MTVKIVIGILFYCGIWMALSIWMIYIKQRRGEFGRRYEMEPLDVFLIMAAWPLTALIWFMWQTVKKAAEMMEDDP